VNDRQLIGGGVALLVVVVGWAAWVSGDAPEAPIEEAVGRELLTGDAAGQGFQESLHQAIGAARSGCLHGWQDTLPADVKGELVIDAIVVDGVIDRVDLRAVGISVPEDILDCVEEQAMGVYWPETALTGERRFQRTMELP